ncbi:hypothetical protein [Micromonospora chalcea]|uniref:hypothetical protein n=1 Tax=Micromonospora chalcea TaxID=1874 RepID=UPI003D72F372
MAEIQAGAAANMGADIIIPGSTYEGLLEEPGDGWSVLFGDESTAYVTLDGTLDELEATLAQALDLVRYRQERVRQAQRGTVEVEVAGCAWTVPAEVYNRNMTDDQAVADAIKVVEHDES